MAGYDADAVENGGRRQLAWAGGFLFLSLVALLLPDAAQQEAAGLIRGTVLRPFVWTQETLARTRMQAVSNTRLRSRLDSLVALSVERSTLEEENLRLRGLLSLSARLPAGWASASVIRPGTEGSESMFLLDVGSDDGIRPNAPVVTREGLVGMVREVRGSSAIGMDWTHPDFRASAMDVDGLVYGLVEAFRGDFREEDRLQLTGTAFHAELAPGTPVVTSGLGGVLPRGIPVGRVVTLAEAEAGWRKSYWLEPMVQPGSVTQVLVGTGAPPSLDEDLSEAWPRDSILTHPELRAADSLRTDSLSLLRDSLARLESRLRELHPDSLTGGVPGEGGTGGGSDGG